MIRRKTAAMPFKNTKRFILSTVMTALSTLVLSADWVAAAGSVSSGNSINTKSIPAGLQDSLNAGQAQDIIVEFDSQATDNAAAELRDRLKAPFGDSRILNLRAQRYEAQKQTVLARMPSGRYQRVTQYSHLPLEVIRLRNAAALQALMDDAEVTAIYRDEVKYPVLDSVNTSLINLPSAETLGLTGAGATVAVIDTGVNYLQSDFGCTALATPSTCKVNYYHSYADNSTSLDSNGHGTNVSGIVVGVAPNARVAGLNVFGASSSASDSKIILALNWVIANQAAYNIVAVNMSLGDSVNHGAGCSGTAYSSPISQLLILGVETYVASGNNGFNTGVSGPACVPGVNAVGAVYSSNIGGANWGVCTDSSSAADQATCFSNLPPSGALSYNFLLAPGVNITAGGYIASGTSQATPFVAGAQALLAAAIPQNMPTVFNRTGQSPGYYLNLASGVAKSITRTGYSATLERLDLSASLATAGDLFSSALALPLVANNIAANKESGEPNHAGKAGGKSVWGTWTAPFTGSIQLDTHGSTFDTLLGAYTGLTVASLTQVAANDDDGSSNGNSSVIFQAQAGTSYKIAVDGKNGASGTLGMLFAVPNDNFAARTALSGTSGALYASNWFASAESGEAMHAGQTAQQTIWWKWTAPASGQFTLDTHGSGLDTVLDVVTGNSVSSTTYVASNDNDGSANNASGVVFAAISGTEYDIAVDGKGVIGQIALNWRFTSTVVADLSMSLASTGGSPGANFNYLASLTNNGPATATNTHLVFSLPSGVSYVGASRNDGGSLSCTATAQTVNCSLGAVYSSAAVAVSITLVANNIGNYSTTVTASSDVSDTSSGNNSAAAVAQIADGDVADAPTLPQWAAMLLGMLLLGGATARWKPSL